MQKHLPRVTQNRCLVVITTVALAGCGNAQRTGVVDVKPATRVSVCEILKNFEKYRNKEVDAIGVYWFGLRESCPEPFITGDRKWPAALHLVDAGATAGSDMSVRFETDRKSWDDLQLLAVREGKAGKREEIWTIIRGEVRVPDKYVRADGSVFGGYGHMGAFPAELVIRRVLEVSIKSNATYDYRDMVGPHL